MRNSITVPVKACDVFGIFGSPAQHFMRPTFLFSALLVSVSFTALSQSDVLDSLNREYSSAEADTTKINILLDIVTEYDFSDTSGLEVAKKAYTMSQNVESEQIKSLAKAKLGLFYYEMNIDSGGLLLDQAIREFEEINLASRISDTYWNMSNIQQKRNSNDSAIYFLNKSLTNAIDNEYNFGIAEANYSLGLIFNIRGKNSLALRHSIEARDYYEKDGKRKEVSQALNQIGIVYDYMGLYAEAVENYLRAREIAIETQDTQGEILIINNLGVVYDNMNNPDAALEYYEEALEKSGIFEFIEDEATLLNNISYIYMRKGDTLQAKKALWKALRIGDENGIACFEQYPQEGLGSLYVALNQLDSAGYYLDKALINGIECEDVGVLTSVYKSMGQLFEKRGELNSALRAFNKSLELAKEADLNNDLKGTLLALYNFHKNQGNITTALSYLESYRVLSDSLQETKNIEKANQLAAEYEFRKQVEAVRAEQLANEMALEEKIEAQNRERMFILLALVLVFLLLLTLGRSYFLIQKQNKKLKWLNEEKNTLMGVVAHDLRNPLNMIKGLMQLVVGVKTVSEEEDSEKYLHLIKLSTQKMTDMIDKVLDISAIENMKVNLNMSKEDLTKLLTRSTENFEHLAAKKDIKIEQVYDTGSACYSEVDSNYFEQVMDNLISNGIKFSDPGKKLTINVKNEEGFQVVSVKDEGPGISEEEQKNLFNRFKTLAAKPTSNEQSTGLGLSIVKKFVTAMGGEIFCESELGIGTTFFLKFKEA